MFDSTAPLNYHQQPCPRARSYTQATSTHTRAGALTFPSSCLDGCVTRVGPSQHPQYTRAWSAREAVGSSQATRHVTPPPQTMGPTTLQVGRQSLARNQNFYQTYQTSRRQHSKLTLDAYFQTNNCSNTTTMAHLSDNHKKLKSKRTLC